MNLEVIKLSPKEWELYAENAHKIVFNEIRPKEMNRIDFALLCGTKNEPYGYGTFREVDSNMVYMQYGGVFPNSKNTIHSWQVYKLIIDELKRSYKYATTLIENNNAVMLKFAMKYGFKIIGVRTFENKILCELLINFMEE